MEIVDINFNFELFEDQVEKRYKVCDQICEHLESLIYLSDELDNFDPASEFFMDIDDIIAEEVVGTVDALQEKSKDMVAAIDVYVALMQSRIHYLETTKTEDEILSNYKIRTERQSLRSKISKYKKLKDDFSKSIENLAKQVDDLGYGYEDDAERDVE